MEFESGIADVDLQLALKLKDKYPEHFQNLVRMHLSFALDLNIEEKDEPIERIKANPNKWSFHKKTKNAKDAVDGDPLNETKIARMCKLISFLSREENIAQEGIFRKTGAVSRQQQLKTCLNEGMAVDFDDNNFSVHDCASVLKNFLAELPEPLVTDAYYPLYCQISEWCKCEEYGARLLRSLQLLMLLLPSHNALLLKYIINLLHITSKHAEENKMNAENLATLFTPHVLCPRKLSGEVFHTNAQMLYQIVVFMIERGLEIFKIPAGLAADIRLYWHEKEKKKLSPKNMLNESVADSCVVNTIFSFVDREKTAKENVTNPTETALAQLYAHIQSMPESSKKRKLVKQFNKENGYGTPKRVLLNNNDKAHSLTKNISDSLKKHLFSKASSKSEKSTKSSTKNKSDGHIVEVMMTPRSRQPVLAVSGSNNTNLSTKGKNEFLANSNSEEDRSKSQANEHFQTCLGSSKEQVDLSNQSAESLTDTFREYLYSRSMLTTSIADDSFSSRSGDFDPSTVSEDKLSDSLLYCLDGGTPSQEMNSHSNGDHSHHRLEHDDSDQNYTYHQRSRVHETVL